MMARMDFTDTVFTDTVGKAIFVGKTGFSGVFVNDFYRQTVFTDTGPLPPLGGKAPCVSVKVSVSRTARPWRGCPECGERAPLSAMRLWWQQGYGQPWRSGRLMLRCVFCLHVAPAGRFERLTEEDRG